MLAKERQMIALGTLAAFGTILLALMLCAELHLVIPIPWMRQVTGCQLTLGEREGLVTDLVCNTFTKVFTYFLLALGIAAAAPRLHVFASSVPIPIPRYLRLHPPRRDRLIECFRRGIINPKIF